MHKKEEEKILYKEILLKIELLLKYTKNLPMYNILTKTTEYSPLVRIHKDKIPHTGDKASLDRCG